MFLALTASVSFAGLLEAWTPEEFPSNDYVAGSDGWMNGWDEDEWLGIEYQGTRFVSPVFDEGDDGRFGDGGAHDNWLWNEAVEVHQGEFVVSVYTDDDDGFGLVFGATDDERYLLLFCGYERSNGTDCPSGDVDEENSGVLFITGRGAELLEGGEGTVEAGATEMVVSMNDGELTITAGRVEYRLEVGEEFMLSGVGFYGYNQGQYSGNGQDDGTSSYYYDAVLYFQDDDNDSVPDDTDNCEKVANADQADLDNDGIGSACDDAEDVDTGGDTDTGTDTGDTGNGGGGGGNGDDGIGLTAPGDCGCSSTTPAAGAALLALAALASTRRRRG